MHHHHLVHFRTFWILALKQEAMSLCEGTKRLIRCQNAWSSASPMSVSRLPPNRPYPNFHRLYREIDYKHYSHFCSSPLERTVQLFQSCGLTLDRKCFDSFLLLQSPYFYSLLEAAHRIELSDLRKRVKLAFHHFSCGLLLVLLSKAK